MVKNLSILFLLIIAVTSCQDDKTITVHPGTGIDNISFEHSDSIDILNYKGLEYERTSGTSHVDGFDWFCEENWIRFHSPEYGLTFTFSTPCVNNPDDYGLSLVSIKLDGTQHAGLENGIKIGETTYDEVINIYGKPFEHWQNESFLEYEHLSMGLRFNDEEILYEITIYEY